MGLHKTINHSVGKGGKNSRNDITTIIELLNDRRKRPFYQKPQLFHIFRKHKKYTSRTYNARMDYAMFFTYDGKAIHQSTGVWATSILKDLGFDYFGSHGCVRHSESNAKELFNWSPLKTLVFIDMA